MAVAVASAALSFVLCDVDGDAVQVRGDKRLPAEAGQGAIQAEEDILSEIVEMFAAAGKAQKGAEDHLLMVAYHLLEAEIGLQAGLDLKQR